MVFTILQGCLPYSNDWNIRECECTYGSYYARNGQDAKEQYEIERRKNNVVIRGMHEDDSENALSLIENITKFFEDRFAMRDVIVYAAHRYMLCDMFSFCYASCYRICRT